MFEARSETDEEEQRRQEAMSHKETKQQEILKVKKRTGH